MALVCIYENCYLWTDGIRLYNACKEHQTAFQKLHNNSFVENVSEYRHVAGSPIAYSEGPL